LEAGNKSKQKKQAHAETGNVREHARRKIHESMRIGIHGKQRK